MSATRGHPTGAPAVPRFRRLATLGLTALAVGVGSAALGGCAAVLVGGAVVGGTLMATDRRTAGAQVDDEVIELKATGRLNETFGDRASISTTSYNRVLLLTGEVASAADKALAEQVVAGLDNVQSVVNELTVGALRNFGARSGDAFVTAKVKASFVDAKDIFAQSVKVVTHNGVVYLMGRVTEREANRATDVARGVAGVRKVVRVFTVLTEAELADIRQKAPAKP